MTNNDLIIIWHNPKCSKSRACLEYLNSLNKNIIIKLYLEEKTSYQELKEILRMLNYQPIDLVRKKEFDYINNKNRYKDLIQLMVVFPKIIERPIVIFNEKAKIARPLENVINMFK